MTLDEIVSCAQTSCAQTASGDKGDAWVDLHNIDDGSICDETSSDCPLRTFNSMTIDLMDVVDPSTFDIDIDNSERCLKFKGKETKIQSEDCAKAKHVVCESHCKGIILIRNYVYVHD